jgi:hypothetical protein
VTPAPAKVRVFQEIRLQPSTSDYENVCQDHGACHGQDRRQRIQAQAEQALALGCEFGLLIEPDVTWADFLALCPDADGPREREAIEFVHATPLEYLSRWLASNQVFGDDVRVVSVIRWADGMISFGITQPQYHGVPAETREIEAYFHQAGWTRLKDPSGHTVFFNYAFGVIAIDAEKRNCYVSEGGLQPFDVILCEPDESLERCPGIYP